MHCMINANYDTMTMFNQNFDKLTETCKSWETFDEDALLEVFIVIMITSYFLYETYHKHPLRAQITLWKYSGFDFVLQSY